mmetsp:Transcript_26919/g.43764  ORF Transcript_26919/g.43764 Transcript_26919/m.43764 type:complete len:163 (+) Transcript_26919:320-808(+)
MEKAVNLLTNYCGTQRIQNKGTQVQHNGMVSVQQGRSRGGRGSPARRGEHATTINNETRTNSAGESHCFNCGEEGHWASDCPYLEDEQQAQLQMNLDAGDTQEEDDEDPEEEVVRLLQVSLFQGNGEQYWLNKDRAYLGSCSTVTAFRTPVTWTTSRRLITL